MSPFETISAAYAAFGRNDPSVLFGAMDPAITWNEAEGNPLSDRNPYVGPQAIGEGVFGRLLAALEAVKTYRALLTTQTPSGPSQRRMTAQLPDRMRLESLSGGKVASCTVVDGSKGQYHEPGKTGALGERSLADLQDSLRTDPLSTLLAASRPDAQLSYRGETKVQGRLVDALEVRIHGPTVTLFVAADDGELLAYQHASRQGKITVLHSDFRVVAGLHIAHTNTIMAAGKRFVVTLSELTINSSLPGDTFDITKCQF